MPPLLTGKKNRTGIALPKGFEKAENWVLACDSMENAALILNTDGVIQYANPAAIKNLGENATGKKWDLVIKDSIQIESGEHSLSLKGMPLQRVMTGERLDSEYWRISFSGKAPADLLISASPLLRDNRQIGTLVTWFDFTLLNQDWESKRTGEPGMRQFIDAFPEAMYLVDEQSILLISNQAGAAAFGKSPADIVGKCLFDLIPPEIASDQKRKMQSIFNSGRPSRFEVQSGGQFYDQCMYPIIDQNKQVKLVALFLLNMTPYRKIEHELRKSEERYRNLVESTSDVVFQLDANYRFMYVSPVIEQTLHYQPEELIGKEFNQYIHPEDQMSVIGFLEKFSTEAQRIEFRMLDKKRKKHTVSAAFRHTVNHNTHPSIFGILTDVSEKRQAEEELRYREERFRSLIEKTMDIILIVDLKGKVNYASPSVEYVLGYQPDEIIGKRAITLIHPDDIGKVVQAVKYGLYTADFGRFIEFRVMGKDGKLHIIEAIGRNLVDNPAIAGVVINARDITERRIAEDKLWYLSTHDTMTDLYNRAYFNEEMARIERGRIFPISIFMADVDGLKEVNDDLGHSAGDELLRNTAQLLRNSFRTEDVVARIGGDEFAVLLPGADEIAAQAAMSRVRRNLQAFNDQIEEVRLSLSFGVATGQKGIPLEEVLRKADENMYTEKLAKLGRKARGTGPLSGLHTLPDKLS